MLTHIEGGTVANTSLAAHDSVHMTLGKEPCSPYIGVEDIAGDIY